MNGSILLEDVHTCENAARRLRAFIARRVPASDVDDVLQDTWLRVQRGLPGLRDEDRLGAWFYQIARSSIAEHQRRRHRTLFSSMDTDDDADQSASDDDDALARQCARSLASFISQLPSPYREAIALVELEGVSQRDAARMLGLSDSGMKSRVQRGRARLRALFEACCRVTTDVRGHVMACERRAPDVPCCGK